MKSPEMKKCSKMIHKNQVLETQENTNRKLLKIYLLSEETQNL